MDILDLVKEMDMEFLIMKVEIFNMKDIGKMIIFKIKGNIIMIIKNILLNLMDILMKMDQKNALNILKME